MTCSNAQSIRIARLWALHDIGPDPASSFINATSDSAHFDFKNVNHFEFDHVTAWNMNFNFRIISCIEGLWIDPFTYGFYDVPHPQTIASILLDGADGTGLGHPQLMRIEEPQFGSYLLDHQTVTLRGGRDSRTLDNRQVWRGPKDHVLVRSVEDLQIIGGIGNDAAESTLHLAPRGDPLRPIMKVRTDGLFYDGAGVADVYIENGDPFPCAEGGAAIDVKIADSFLDGETTGLYGVYVPGERGCPAAIGLFLEELDASAYVRTPFFLAAVDGGHLTGSSARGYNVIGIVADDVALASAVWLSRQARNFAVDDFAAGGGTRYEAIDRAHLPGTAPYAANQDQYGVSVEAGAANVLLRHVSNMGFNLEYPAAAPTVSCGAGCVLKPGSDIRRGEVVLEHLSGPVTTASLRFNAPFAGNQSLDCTVTDAISATGMPIASAVRTSDQTGFSVVFAADIGAGGLFRYRCR